MPPVGLQPTTSALKGPCSEQLSYGGHLRLAPTRQVPRAVGVLFAADGSWRSGSRSSRPRAPAWPVQLPPEREPGPRPSSVRHDRNLDRPSRSHRNQRILTVPGCCTRRRGSWRFRTASVELFSTNAQLLGANQHAAPFGTGGSSHRPPRSVRSRWQGAARTRRPAPAKTHVPSSGQCGRTREQPDPTRRNRRKGESPDSP